MDSERLWKYIENTRIVVAFSVVLFIILAVGVMYLTPAVPPQEHPDKPDNLTKEKVLDIVSNYERAEVYRAYDPDENTEFHVECPSVVDRVTDRGYYVITSCNGGFNAPDGRSGHFGTGSRFYLVNETATIRVPTEDKRRDNYTNTGSFRGTFYIANFDNRDYSINVRVENMTSESRALNQSYEVQEKRGIGQSHAAPPGQYTLIATTEDGKKMRYKWEITSDVTTRRSPAIYITPTGELLIRPIPESS